MQSIANRVRNSCHSFWDTHTHRHTLLWTDNGKMSGRQPLNLNPDRVSVEAKIVGHNGGGRWASADHHLPHATKHRTASLVMRASRVSDLGTSLFTLHATRSTRNNNVLTTTCSVAANSRRNVNSKSLNLFGQFSPNTKSNKPRSPPFCLLQPQHSCNTHNSTPQPHQSYTTFPLLLTSLLHLL